MGKETNHFVEDFQRTFDDVYARLYQEYAPYVGETHRHDYRYVPDISIPDSVTSLHEDIEDIVVWVNTTAGLVSPTLFETPERQPTSHLHLQAILANAYVQTPEPLRTPKAQEYFQRLFVCTALVPTGQQFMGHGYREGTTDRIETFLREGLLTHRGFSHLMMDLLVRTIPYTADTKPTFHMAQRKLKTLLASIKQEGRKRFGDALSPGFLETSAPVFHPPIEGEKILTPSSLDSRQTWYRSISAAGLYLPDEKYSGLPLNVHSATAARIAGDNFDTEVATARLLVVHEELHRQEQLTPTPDPKPDTDFEYALFELITDTAAHILVHYEQSGKERDFRPHTFSVGYRNLAFFAKDLLAAKVFTTDEIVYFGSHQLWKQFYTQLCSRLRRVPPHRYEVLYESLVQNELIVGSDKYPFSEAVELHTRPEVFLPREFARMKRVLAIKEFDSLDPSDNELFPYLEDSTEPSAAFICMADDMFRRHVHPNEPLLNWRYSLYIHPDFIDGFRSMYLHAAVGMTKVIDKKILKPSFESILKSRDPDYLESVAISAEHYAAELYDAVLPHITLFLEQASPGYAVTEEDLLYVCTELIPAWYAGNYTDFSTIPEFIADVSGRLESVTSFYRYESTKRPNPTSQEATIIANRALHKLTYYAAAMSYTESKTRDELR